MVSAVQRLSKESVQFQKVFPEGCSGGPLDYNLFHWRINIEGPKGTFYEGFTLTMELYFPNEYPNKPPECYFNPPIYHPNISIYDGSICADFITNPSHWKSTYTVYQIVNTFLFLLNNPNTKSCLNGKAGMYYDTKIEFYEKALKEYMTNIGKNK